MNIFTKCENGFSFFPVFILCCDIINQSNHTHTHLACIKLKHTTTRKKKKEKKYESLNNIIKKNIVNFSKHLIINQANVNQIQNEIKQEKKPGEFHFNLHWNRIWKKNCEQKKSIKRHTCDVKIIIWLLCCCVYVFLFTQIIFCLHFFLFLYLGLDDFFNNFNGT